MINVFFSTLVSFRGNGRPAPLAFAAVAPAARLEAEGTDAGLKFGDSHSLHLIFGSIRGAPQGEKFLEQVSFARRSLYHHVAVKKLAWHTFDYFGWWLNRCERDGIFLALHSDSFFSETDEIRLRSHNIIAITGLKIQDTLNFVREMFDRSWKGLRHLDLDVFTRHNRPLDLTPLADVPPLETLVLCTPLFTSRSISVLHRCPNLTTVSFERGVRSDAFRELCTLPKLRNLALKEFQDIESWSPLLSCRFLETLQLVGGSHLPTVLDLEGLMGVTNLVLSDLGDVERLVLPQNRTLEILKVQNCPKLTSVLNLDDNSLMREISLASLPVQTVSLAGCKRLSNLSIEDCASLSPPMCLEATVQLTDLSLRGLAAVRACGLLSTDGLSTLFPESFHAAMTLNSLVLSDCHDVKCLDLSLLTSLEYLWIESFDSLTELRGLSKLTQLYCLHLFSAAVAQIDITETCALEEVYIQHCRNLTRIVGLENKGGIHTFFVKDCPQLTSLEFGKSPSLTACVATTCKRLLTVTVEPSHTQPDPKLYVHACSETQQISGFRLYRSVTEEQYQVLGLDIGGIDEAFIIVNDVIYVWWDCLNDFCPPYKKRRCAAGWS